MTTDDVTPDITPTDAQPGDEEWEPFNRPDQEHKYRVRYKGQEAHMVSALAPDYSSALCGVPASQLKGGLYIAYACEQCETMAQRGTQVPMISDECAGCDGLIYASRTLLTTRYTGEWLHLLQSDWIDNVHHAVPKNVTLPEGGS